MDLDKVKAFFADRKVHLPSPPALAVRLLEQVRRDDYRQLAETIRLDPALAARVLGLANSPLYRGGGKEITSLEKAIAFLGTEVIKNLALTFKVYEGLKSEKKLTRATEFDMEHFWKRSVANAVGARLLAQEMGLEEDHLFSAGLLMDIGVLALYLLLGEDYLAAFDEKEVSQRSLAEIEREMWGFTHAEAGGYFLKTWSLPDHLVMDITYHHCWTKAPEEYRAHARILSLAGLLGGIYFSRRSAFYYEETLSQFKDLLGFPEENTREIIDRVAEETNQLLAFFELPGERIPPYSHILEEVREELGKLSLNYVLLVKKLQEEKARAEELARKLKAANERLRQLSIRDGLTELYNHRYFQERLREEFERARRYRRALSLVILDIDHFKKVNDTYGHPVGDQVLKELARLIRQSMRTSDIPARYGGEEFTIILPETDLQGASCFGERLRKTVEQHSFEANGLTLQITISLGVSSVFPSATQATPQRLIEVADKALYYSKTHGRNRLTAVSIE
ncbi:diguanylate cyclase [Thermosulfurimonas marina]|uniref:diguanylate cyclase n=1 Tax=Thermosulfurimonas marina TaxID=2047767 RepID=A0A6H1WSB7_9BACT|nr:GGDEF domain-containing protein [Thermosulfurimonas marina]QJA06026.1 diguanylate cyclase [Thermosulfurimonas marina]